MLQIIGRILFSLLILFLCLIRPPLIIIVLFIIAFLFILSGK